MRHLPALLLGVALLAPAVLAATTLINTINNSTADEVHAFKNFDAQTYAVGDFDGDGKPELVGQNDNRYVYVMSTTSPRVLAEFIPPYPPSWGARPINDPVVADLDGDRNLDIIVVTSAGTICDYEYGAGWTFTQRWCKTMNQFGSPGADAGAAVGDVDGDGKQEVFSMVEEKGLFAFNWDGSLRWSKNEWGGNSGPLLTDLDGDGRQEIIFFSDGGTVRAYDASSGAAKWTFFSKSYVTPASIPVSGNAADLNGDGKKEVVFVARDAHDATNYYNDHFMIFVLDHNGKLRWRDQPSWGNPMSYSHPALVDVDGDGLRDIVLQDWNTIGHKPGNWEKLGPANVFAYKGTNGALLWRTVISNSWSNDDIAIADVDGDGKQEVLTIGYNGGQDGMWYLDLRTGVAEGHVSIGSGTQVLRGPIAGNLDGSGKTSWAASTSGTGSEGGFKVFRTDANCNVAFGGWDYHNPCGGSSGGGNPPPPPTGNSFTFTPTGGNEWWAQLKVDPKPAQVQAMDTGGAWVGLAFKSWGQWAGSFHIEPGNQVKYRASNDGTTWKESCLYDHPANTCTGGSPPPGSGTLSVTWSRVRGNEWWIEADATTTSTLSGVDARVDGGAWTALDHRSYGSWAKSIHALPGSKVEFRATDTGGMTAISGQYTWPPA